MDKKEALKKVKRNCLDLYELDEKFKKDKEVVIAAIKSEPGSLEYVDKSLIDDPEIVSMAILNSKNGVLMQHAGKKLEKIKNLF